MSEVTETVTDGGQYEVVVSDGQPTDVHTLSVVEVHEVQAPATSPIKDMKPPQTADGEHLCIVVPASEGNVQTETEAATQAVNVVYMQTTCTTSTPQSAPAAPGSTLEIESEGAACLVCGDKGSGYHYSVFSCEGCKGFFKRTVQKRLQYACKEDGQCIVNKFTRNSCQFCRFKKCAAMGMKKEAVREDRTPGGKHRNKRPKVESEGTVPAMPMLDDSQFDHDFVQKIIAARPDLIPTTEDVLAGIVDGEPRVEQISLNDLMQYGYMELRLIIEWARKVPGFSDLLIEDQMALLKASFMEINVLRLSYRSLETPGCVKFAHGITMNSEQSQNIGWGKDLINCTVEFMERLQDINIDLAEFCLLNAVVLTYPDAAGIKDIPAVVDLQSKILDCLRKYDLKTYPQDVRRHGKILLRIPVLRTVSTVAAERFLSMSLDGSIKMNALVLEMMS